MDYGIRFAGIPSGYEISSLLHAIILVSKRDSGLKPAVRNQLNDVKKTCSIACLHHTHLTILLASHGACPLDSNGKPMIQAEIIEANVFYDLTMRYNVSSVPLTTINDGAGLILGSVPEEYLLQEIKREI